MSFYLETALKNKRQEKEAQKILKKYSERVRNKPFWYWNREDHIAAHKQDKDCCWAHILGAPKKYGKPYPLFDYQKQVIDAIEDCLYRKHETKYRGVYCLKASGLGLTTLMLYYMSYLALKDNSLQSKNMIILTAPRLELSIDLIRRMKALFPDVIFDSKETLIELNKCRITALPSHNSAALRGAVDTVLLVADEASHWHPNEEDEINTVIQRMIPKMGTVPVLISTPRAPGDLMHRILLQPDDQTFYKKILLPYHVGLGKIFTTEEIEMAKRKLPSFEKEFNLVFSAGFQGTFNQLALDDCIKAGDQVDYNTLYMDDKTIVMGADFGFGGASSTALTITRLNREPDRHDYEAVKNFKSVIEVVLSETHFKPDFNQVVNRILWLMDHYNIKWCFLDDSSPEVLRALCLASNQRLDYRDEIKYWEEERHIDLFAPWAYGCFSGKFYPTTFSKKHKELLAHTRRIVDSRILAIPRHFDYLIRDLQTATDIDDILVKDSRNPMDSLDSLRCALQFYRIDDTDRDYSSGSGDMMLLPWQQQQQQQPEPPYRDLNRYMDS